MIAVIGYNFKVIRAVYFYLVVSTKEVFIVIRRIILYYGTDLLIKNLYNYKVLSKINKKVNILNFKIMRDKDYTI